MAKYLKLITISESDASKLKCAVDPGYHCRGSDCMAWVWEYSAEETKHPFPQPSTFTNEERTTNGRCGMVRK